MVLTETVLHGQGTLLPSNFFHVEYFKGCSAIQCHSVFQLHVKFLVAESSSSVLLDSGKEK